MLDTLGSVCSACKFCNQSSKVKIQSPLSQSELSWSLGAGLLKVKCGVVGNVFLQVVCDRFGLDTNVVRNHLFYECT